MDFILKKYFKYALVFIFIFSGFAFQTFASTTDGTIDDTNKTALLCTNDACTTTSRINFKPSSVLAGQEVHVTNSELTGFAWSEDMGWIVLDCSNTTSGCSNTNGNFGVKNDGLGNLSGYAWGQNAGWINFGPFLNNTADTVSINSSGEFNGYAWAQNYGWIKFDCSSSSSCVKTDWRAGSSNNHNDDGGSIPGGTTTPTTVPTFCELHPTDSTCITIIPTFCELHPTDSTCITPKPTFCELHSSDPSCVVTPIKTFCELNPADPSCQEKTFCELHPTDPTCQTGDFCELHPSDPSCVGGEIEDKGDDNDDNGNDNKGGLPITQVAIEDFIKFAEINIKKVTIDTIEVIKTPVGKTMTDIITATGIVSGASLSIATLLFANPLTFGELFLIPLRLWSLILAALGIKKRSRPWGTVYDSVTKQPLDPAYVVLQDLNGNEVATSITDLDGRYGFLVPAGQYRLLANKTNYEFPSKKLIGRLSDELYSDLYFNEIITLTEGDVVTKNIPMDPLKFDWNEFAKKDQKLMKFFSKRDVWIARLSNFLFAFGFIITAITVVATPKIYNVIIFSVYAILYVLKHTVLKRSPSGKITQNGEPLSFAIIRVFSVATDHEIIHKVADKIGKYYCLVPNGNYYVKIEKKNEDGTYTLVHTSNQIEVKDGYIGNKFKI